MTGIYDWNPMPHVLDVRCPSCRGCARFEFAEVVRIKLLQDVPFFQASAQFEYAFFLSNWAGQNWHGAIYFPGLHGSATTTIHGLPEGYEAAAWEHSKLRDPLIFFPGICTFIGNLC